MTTTIENLVVPAGTTFTFDFFAVESDGTTPILRLLHGLMKRSKKPAKCRFYEKQDKYFKA